MSYGVDFFENLELIYLPFRKEIFSCTLAYPIYNIEMLLGLIAFNYGTCMGIIGVNVI